MAGLSHSELVTRAEGWLRRSARIPGIVQPDRLRRVQCGVVFTEYVSATSEVPDALGWCFCGRQSILVECKASRADFLADRGKYFREHPQLGVGMFRYYLAPAGIVGLDELPAKWGLLTIDRKITVTVPAQEQERNIAAELGILWSECRKIQIVQRGGSLMPTRAGTRVMECLASAQVEAGANGR